MIWRLLLTSNIANTNLVQFFAQTDLIRFFILILLVTIITWF